MQKKLKKKRERNMPFKLKMSRDRKRVRDALRRKGFGVAVDLTLDIMQRKASAAQKPPTKAARKEMATSDIIYNELPAFLFRKVKLPPKDEE
jgi:hypothetical protein